MTISTFTLITHILLTLADPMKSVQAYLDPGSGSFILQILLAALVGGLFIVKSYWKKIAEFFRKLFSRGDRGGEG